MSRIVALNEVKSNDKPKDENSNLELQETLAETEYMRAIKLKTQGKYETSLFLLTELLQTKVLNDTTAEDNKNKKLHLIRYNCYKNAAFIYEEHLRNNDKALENYIMALHMDNSDVYLSQRCAQLALKMDLPELAEFYFENCLQHNQNHWLAADGLLQAMCRDNNILGCYYLACKLYERDGNLQCAKRVLQEIATRFPHLFELYKGFMQVGGMDDAIKNNENPNNKERHGKRKHIFAEQSVSRHKSLECSIDIKPFELKFIELSWHTIGKYIVDVYDYLRKRQYPFYILRLEDIVDVPDLESLDLEAIEQSNLDSNGKPKRRKRCSDVELLQQWSWWPKGKTQKNVRFDLPDDADDDICLRYYLAECCDVCKKLKTSLIDFDVQTKTDFSTFINELKPMKFDLIFLNEYWLKFIASFWHILLPNEINALYFDSFTIYKSNFDVNLWDQLDSSKALESAVNILLFYLEMYLTKLEGPEKPSKEWEALFYALKLKLQQSHMQLIDNYQNFELRILNLEYLWTLYENLVDDCIACLLSLEKVLEKEPEDYALHLPNGYCISKDKIIEIRTEIEEEISNANDDQQ